jgi:hypothetical protein
MFEFCPLLNISECAATENKAKFLTFVYNPLPRAVSSWVRLPVVGVNYQVNEDGTVIASDLSEVTAETKAIPERNSNADHELTFKADVPALSFKLYTIEPVDGSGGRANTHKKPKFFKV